MDFVAGAIPDQFTAGDPWLAGLPDDAPAARCGRRSWTRSSAINAAGFDGLGLRTGLDAELDWWDQYVEWAADGSPPAALAEVVRGVAATVRPASRRPRCCGATCASATSSSTRDRRPRAVLDWDMASVGPAEMDLAWFLGLEARAEPS